MTETIHPVLAAAGRYRRQLLQREDQAVNRLVQAYATAYRNIGTQIEAMQEVAVLGPLTRDNAVKLAQLRALRQAISEELGRFGVIADNEMTQLSREGITLGLNHSTGLVEAYFNSPQALQALRASFTQLVPEQVETLLGFLAPDSPLRDGLTNRLGDEIANRVSAAMVDGLVRGMNPRTIAATLRREFGVGLPWAVNTVRTANLWAYREATRANYIANRNVVSGWTWYATLDRRVCHSCISKHGSRYPVDAVLNDHHQGRCSAIPEVPLAKQLGIDLPEIESGEQWFRRQDADTQTAIMGPGMLAAWKAGAVRFDQLSVTYNDPVYGPMQRAATLSDLGLERYAQGGVGTARTRRSTPPQPKPAPAPPKTPVKAAIEALPAVEASAETAQKGLLAIRDKYADRVQAAEELRRRFESSTQDIARLTARQDEILVESLNATPERKKELTRESNRIRKELREINKLRDTYTPDMLSAIEERNAEARKLLYVADPASNKVVVGRGFTDAQQRAVETGLAEFNRLVSREVWDGNTINVDALNPGQRSYALGALNRIFIDPLEGPRATIHELAHVLEQKSGKLDQVLDFFDKRTAGDRWESLSALTGKQFGENERTKKDRWYEPYIGADYNRKATEILSMGIERMYRDPIGFTQDDPDMFGFIFDLVRGRDVSRYGKVE